MKKQTASLLLIAAVVGASVPSAAADKVRRTSSGRPDLSGSYDAATLTPLERPAKLGDKAFLTVEEARALAAEEAAAQAKGLAQTDGDREAPPPGGAKVVGLEDTATGGNEFGAGNVGGYNLFWIDRGTEAFTVDGKIPTSIIVDPKNGRMPAMTPAAQKEMMSRFSSFLRPNDGTAWWLDEKGPGPYDGPESLAISERCILGFTGATPTLPSLYNNFKRIVQTEDHVMILIEMVHDARIVRMNSKHPGPEVRKWLGDSIGWWEGDTLVVDTTNFHPESSMRGGSQNMHVVEKFTLRPDGNVLYRFTVEDKETWTAPWTGEYVWHASDDRVFEYACHEGNYAMGNVLRGARLLEQEALAKKK
jgi:hypothetical protein